jgi:hypothetical protein
MNATRTKNQNVTADDDAPATVPQTTPPAIGYGHPEYHFVQSISEVNKTLGVLEAKLEALKESSNSSEIKQDIRELKSDMGKIKDELHSAKIWILSLFGAGFLALLVVFSVGYLRLSDHEEKLTSVVSDMRVSIQQLVDAIPAKKH